MRPSNSFWRGYATNIVILILVQDFMGQEWYQHPDRWTPWYITTPFALMLALLVFWNWRVTRKETN